MRPLSELMDALTSESAATALRVLDDERRLTAFIPELEAGRGFTQPEKHYYTVLDHNLAAVTALEAATGASADGDEMRSVLSWTDIDEALGREIEGLPLMALLRLAALLHDVAKPATATIVEGALRFPRHGPTGSLMLRERLPDLGFGPEATDFIARLVRYHLRPHELVKAWPATDHAIRRFTADLDGYVLPLMLLNVSDGMATRGPGYTRQNFRMHVGLVNYVVARCWAAAQEDDPPLVTGEELMTALDLDSGRLLGRVLKAVRAAQDEGRVHEPETALALARELLAEYREEDRPRTDG